MSIREKPEGLLTFQRATNVQEAVQNALEALDWALDHLDWGDTELVGAAIYNDLVIAIRHLKQFPEVKLEGTL